MKKSKELRALAAVDVSQRYTIAEARVYLRISHASIYKLINDRRLRVLKHGKRTFVPGDEIVRLSRLEAEASSTDDPQTTASERQAI